MSVDTDIRNPKYRAWFEDGWWQASLELEFVVRERPGDPLASFARAKHRVIFEGDRNTDLDSALASARDAAFRKLEALHERLSRSSLPPTIMKRGPHDAGSTVTDPECGNCGQRGCVYCDGGVVDPEPDVIATPPASLADRTRAICRLVFLYGKEDRDSKLYQGAVAELAALGLKPS